MPVTLWDHANEKLQSQGGLRKVLKQWHVKEGIGTPTIAKRLNEMGIDVEQRTVWRWLQKEDINRKGEK